MSMGNGFLRRSTRCSRLEKIRNNIREKMNIKNSVLDYIIYKQLNWHGHVQKMDQERFPPGRQKKFLDVGGSKRNERAGNWRLGMGRQRGVEKEN